MDDILLSSLLLLPGVSFQYKDVWHIVVAIMMWNIWKKRNAVVFQNKHLNLEWLIQLVKAESFFLCYHNDLVSPLAENLWKVDPGAAMHNHLISKKRSFLESLVKKFDLVAFSDGSWKDSKAGIGESSSQNTNP